MKKFLIAVFCILILFSFSSCKKNKKKIANIENNSKEYSVSTEKNSSDNSSIDDETGKVTDSAYNEEIGSIKGEGIISNGSKSSAFSGSSDNESSDSKDSSSDDKFIPNYY